MFIKIKIKIQYGLKVNVPCILFWLADLSVKYADAILSTLNIFVLLIICESIDLKSKNI